jgi:hypothetical protein
MLLDLPVELRWHIINFIPGSVKITNSHPIVQNMKGYFIFDQICKEFRIEKQDWKFLLEQRFRLIEKSTSCETAFNILAKLGLEVSHKKLTTLLTNRITAKVMVEMHDAILSDNTTKFCKLCQHFPHFITDHIVISQNNGFWCKNSLILPRMTPQSSFKIPCDSVFVCARNIEVEETQTILTFIKEHNKSQKLRKLVQTGPNKNLRPKPKLKIQ